MMELDPENSYTQMQRHVYKDLANTGAERIVGNPIGHLNNYELWDKLFINIDLTDKLGLDFGCGPGRNIEFFGAKFKQLDGVDLAQEVINRANEYLREVKYPHELFVCDGISLNGISDTKYDIVMSTIALQHICVYDIRYNYFKEFYRVLKPQGWFTAQMGFGKRDGSVDYYANNYGAGGTNGTVDVNITDPKYLEKDLLELGFQNFSFEIVKTHPTDVHDNWIFFRAQKP